MDSRHSNDVELRASAPRERWRIEGPVLLGGALGDLHDPVRQRPNNSERNAEDGSGSVWETPIKSAYDSQGQKFEDNYKKFLQGGITVQGDKGPIGVLTDNESPVKSIDKALNPSSWNMPQVFTAVTVARGLMEFADLFLLLLGQFIMIA